MGGKTVTGGECDQKKAGISVKDEGGLLWRAEVVSEDGLGHRRYQRNTSMEAKQSAGVLQRYGC